MSEEFRLRVGNKVFRPGSRQEIEKLFKIGRVSGSDLVSVRNGPWITVAQFFGTAPASHSFKPQYADPDDEPLDAEPALSAPRKRRGPAYRVLRGNKVFGPLNKTQLDALLDSGRITKRDLVCLDSGQWVQLTEVLEEVAAADILGDDEVRVEAEEDIEEEPEIEMLADDWQVIVGTIPSASMQKMHIWELMAAKEISMDSQAHHRHWPEVDWRPIHKIPELVRYIQQQRERFED